jgi:hypothetical protein
VDNSVLCVLCVSSAAGGESIFKKNSDGRSLGRPTHFPPLLFASLRAFAESPALRHSLPEVLASLPARAKSPQTLNETCTRLQHALLRRISLPSLQSIGLRNMQTVSPSPSGIVRDDHNFRFPFRKRRLICPSHQSAPEVNDQALGLMLEIMRAEYPVCKGFSPKMITFFVAQTRPCPAAHNL